MTSDRSSEWQEDDPVSEVAGLASLSDQSEVEDALADRDVELVGVDEAAERPALRLSARCLREQVGVTREEDPATLACAIQELTIDELAGTVLLRGDHVDASQPKAFGDLPGHMDIHVQPDAQRSRPRAFKRVTSTDSPASSRNRRTLSSSDAMTASIAAWLS